MTKLQKLLIEQSEGREKLNTLLDVEPDKLSDEQRGEMTTLTTRAVSIEPELRAAMVAEKPTETTELNNDTEARELTALISAASITDMQTAGRWKSADMPGYYCRGQLAGRGAVARLRYGY